MNGIGLVLAGGGGKGAYQIGAWKYLREAGLDRYVSAVSGTSVGALNAALFAAGDLEQAENLWRNIRPEQILTPRGYSEEEIKQWISTHGPESAAPLKSSLPSALAGLIAGSSPFSREGLLQIMREQVDFDAIRHSAIPCYATCMTTAGWEVRRFDLRDYPAEQARQILLASSAIPVVFDAVEIEGESYCDGGVPGLGDNTPIAPLFRLGLPYILVIHLGQDVCIDRERYPDAKVIEITPRADLGGLTTGTLDFTGEGAAWRIEQGYEDAKRALGPFVEASLIHQRNEMIFQAFEESERAYRDRKMMEKAQNVRLSGQEREEYDELYEQSADPAPEDDGQEPYREFVEEEGRERA